MNDLNSTTVDILTDGERKREDEEKKKQADEESDPWMLPDVEIEVVTWSELTCRQKIRRVVWDYFGKLLLIVGCLYFFVCSLDLLSNAFRLLGGKTAGTVFKNSSLLSNPVTGLMIGVLATVLLQSSSTTTGIAISMVVSKVLAVPDVIPIVMGANIGTSVTNTIVSMGQITSKSDFRRAFAGATVHDMFNWLSVLVLLPVEVTTGYLYHLTKAIVGTMSFPETDGKGKSRQFLKTLTKPFTKLIIQIDKRALTDIAQGVEGSVDKSIIKHCCKSKKELIQRLNESSDDNVTYWSSENICIRNCSFMFQEIANHWNDATIGGLVLIISLIILSACFVAIVKTLYSLLRGHILVAIKQFINSDFPGKLSVLTGYVAIAIGTGLTMVVQSSSVVTSALTPLVGIGLLRIERMYPLTLGANLGTTFTAVIIALSQSADDMQAAFHVALCHLFFNISGVLLFYPIPFSRFPIRIAKFLGNKTVKYRWFCIVYMIGGFVLFPAAVFGLSTISWVALVSVAAPVALISLFIFMISVLQVKMPSFLPKLLRTWKFLPLPLRSLQPYDRLFRKFCICHSDRCRCCNGNGIDRSGDTQRYGYELEHQKDLSATQCNRKHDTVQ